jgi:hypothetical protein
MPNDPNGSNDPRITNRDLSKPWNQLHPRSLASSGAELDEGFPDISGPPIAQEPPKE